jgi:hypothetical protein
MNDTLVISKGSLRKDQLGGKIESLKPILQRRRFRNLRHFTKRVKMSFIK